MATSRRVSAVGGGVNVNHPAHWVFQNQQVFGEVKRGLGPIGNWFLCDNGVMKTVKLDARIRRAVRRPTGSRAGVKAETICVQPAPLLHNREGFFFSRFSLSSVTSLMQPLPVCIPRVIWPHDNRTLASRPCESE